VSVQRPESRAHAADDQLSRRAFVGLAGSVAAGAVALRAAANEPAAVPAPDLAVADWPVIRRQFQLPTDLVYMNNGSLGPSAESVQVAAAAARRSLATNPVTQGFGPLLAAADAARHRVAVYLGCAADELWVTRNTTEGMNRVAAAVDWRPGDRVLTSDHEHPGGSICWQHVAARHGVAVDTVQLPAPAPEAAALADAVLSRVTARTRVVSISHVTWTTGTRLPIARIAAGLAGRDVLLVVDGAQGPGALAVDLPALGCDVYATSAHKWLLAPMGAGLLYVRKAVQPQLHDIVLTSGPRVYTGAAGTPDVPGIIGLGAAVDFLAAIGPARVEARALALRRQLAAALAAIPGLAVISPSTDELVAPLVSCALPAGAKVSRVRQRLEDEHRIVVKAVHHPGLQALRLSTHIYNSAPDIVRAAAALGAVIDGRPAGPTK
jgi:selenocysteine lyase/cysteine desulfurase